MSSPEVRYREFLAAVHERLDPPTYFEIGVRGGHSIALASAPAVGVDPAYDIKVDLGPNVTLFRETSDAYFARPDPLEALGGRRIALSFVDGMHHAEFALRDFMNVEAHADWTSVVVIDDVLPRNVDEAARDRHTSAWAGDVFKVVTTLERYRPDLVCIRVGTRQTGVLVVAGLDPSSSVLRDRYDEIERSLVTPDPQRLPRSIRTRRRVVDPAMLMSSGIWDALREAREQDVPRAVGLPALREQVRRELGGAAAPGALERLLDRL